MFSQAEPSIVSEMVERLAKAIWSQRYDAIEWDEYLRWYKAGQASAPRGVTGRSTLAEAFDDARVALVALRQPTAAMVEAGLEKSGPFSVWTAMIDEALK